MNPCLLPASTSRVFLLTSLFVWAGCDREPPTVSRVPKETPPPVAATAANDPHGGMLAAASPELEWETPAGWDSSGPARMSLANFTAQGEQGPIAASIIPLPGAAGKELDVLNIFRERFELPPLTEAEFEGLRQVVPIGDEEGQLFEMDVPATSTSSAGRLAVAVLTRGASCWYIRMTGDAAAVEEQKPAFLGFLQSLRVGDEAAAAGSPMMAASPPPSASGPVLPDWEVPEGWRSQPPTTMVLARFAAGPADAEVMISISVFPGDVGGLVANVNRWRGQIGLAPVGEAEVLAGLTELTTVDGPAQVAELQGKRGDSDLSLIGVVVPRAGRTWFYKLEGKPETAAAQKEAFLEFVQSARHPD